ncbi:hypothetical protein FRB98_005609, partial [Tulasnella sp. 332]
ALELWKLDQSIILAIDVALQFRHLLDWYQQIWPCAAIQRWAEKALGELAEIWGILGKQMA